MIKETLVVWFKAARGPFLVVSFIPAVLGGLIAWYRGSFDPALFGVVTLGVVMAHSAADFIDDYFDFRKGNLGNKEKQFHDSPLIDGKVTPGQVMFAALLCLAVSGAAGTYALLAATVAAGLATPWSLLALGAAPLAVATVRKTSLYADTANYTAAMTNAIALSSVTGLLLIVGYAIAIALG